jgi:hypothetical protein
MGNSKGKNQHSAKSEQAIKGESRARIALYRWKRELLGRRADDLTAEELAVHQIFTEGGASGGLGERK